MTSYLRSMQTVVWLLLVLLTFVSWWLGAGGEGLRDDLPITAAVTAVAVIKIGLVLWHFMEVRSGPSWLRWTCNGWVAFLAVMILALYQRAR